MGLIRWDFLESYHGFQKCDLKVLGKICCLLLTKNQKAIKFGHSEHFLLDPETTTENSYLKAVVCSKAVLCQI